MLDQYFKDEAHNNLLYRYAIEGVSFACKWAYRGATPGSFLSGTNIFLHFATLIFTLRMPQCVASISSFTICLQYICERFRGIALQYLYYKLAPILFSILISCCRCILPVEIAYSGEEVGTRRHKVGFHSEQYI